MNVVNLARRFARDDWGGTETVILETSKALQRMGHHSEIYCTLATASTAEEDFDGVYVRRFPYFYPYIGLKKEARRVLDKKGGSPFSFSLMRALKRKSEIDILHLHAGNRIGGIGRYVAMKRRIPYFMSIHGGVFGVPAEEAASMRAPTQGAFEWGKLLGWWVGSRRILQDAAAVLCVDRNECKLAQENLPNTKVLHLPNGVDVKRFQNGNGHAFREAHGISPDAYVLLTVARIDHQKNQHMLVHILPELLRHEAKTHLLIIGNPTNPAYYDDLLRMVNEMNLTAHVTVIPGIPGSSPELVDAYHAADVFVLPSVHEPFGIVILEAWAAGLPVVASRIGGIPAFVTDNETGLLFTSKDERELVNALVQIRQQPDLAQRLAVAGKDKAVHKFGWDTITSRLADLYEEALRENSLRQ